MILSEEEKNELEDLYQSLLNNELILRMKEIPMHRGSNCYVHSFKVAKESIKRALRRKKRLDYKSLLLACIFHDYYLYDWRKDKEKKRHHASNHPYIAIENAIRDFDIPTQVQDIMKSHMWPINIKIFPHSSEAKILMNVDNLIAVKEFLVSSSYKKKHEKENLEFISKLFD